MTIFFLNLKRVPTFENAKANILTEEQTPMSTAGKLIFNSLQPLILGVIMLLCMPVVAEAQHTDRRQERMQKLAEKRLESTLRVFAPWKHLGKMGIDSLNVQRHNQLIKLYMSPTITHLPIRYPWIATLEVEVKKALGRRFRDYKIELIARDKSLFEFIPNYYRPDIIKADSSRIRKTPITPPLVQNTGQLHFTGGLLNHHIALWHSHGYYYNASKDRWQWQRARLFGTVEDIFPMEYVLTYIAPMLENAGATVLIPRERDTQINEIIVDNDHSSALSSLIKEEGNIGWQTHSGGFAMKDTLCDGENPFLQGTHLRIASNTEASLRYVPDIPAKGEYAVYFSWAYSENPAQDVQLRVNYAGGTATFSINQAMGWGTWVYLGHFYFNPGTNPAEGSLEILTHSATEAIITADAVRFGGGMGNIARRPAAEVLANRLSATDGNAEAARPDTNIPFTGSTYQTSNVPRFMEAARYSLQYAGMPDTLIYWLNEGKNDYNDDYMARGEWVNYLMGAPMGPEKSRNTTGLGIPIDLALAFHTDAGITRTDSVIGTLAIYSAQRDEGLFPDGVSRLASRDLTDLIQDQIVNDIRTLHNPQWTRRAIWDRQYSEAWRPNVPTMLLELLSHQNLEDMRHGLDPRFQFTVSRAIYKGMVRYLAHNQGREAIIQPLPPTHMRIEQTEGKKIRLSWKPQQDLLEPSAISEKFRVYMRAEGKGFDQGIIVENHFLEMELPRFDTVYSFRVTALNEGGESFPSEILSAAIVQDNPKTILVVNGFNRISAPETFDTGTLAGLNWWDGLPVPYGRTFSFTGQQYDYQRSSAWLDDDSPGWGASYADREGQVLIGNTFDNTIIHGSAIRNAGYSFISASREAFEQQNIAEGNYFALSLIMGKQKGVPSLLNPDNIEFRVFSPAMIHQLEEYAQAGGNIFLSGAYIGTDMMIHNDKPAQDFAKETLGYSWRTNNATNTGSVRSTDNTNLVFPVVLNFNTAWHPELYPVEAPDAIEPSGNNSNTIFRYISNQTSAGVFFREGHKVLSLGFPFESITSSDQRNLLMSNIIQLFETNITPENYD